jgi:hypothetical protein
MESLEMDVSKAAELAASESGSMFLLAMRLQ